MIGQAYHVGNRPLGLKRLHWFGLVVPAVLVVALVSCRSGSSGRLTPVTVGTTKSEVNLLILVAQDQGYFAANGLDVVQTTYPSGLAAMAGLLDQEVQLAAGSEFAFAGRVLDGAEIHAVATINRSSIEHLVARADRGISSIADLKGKIIGVPLRSRPEFALHRFLYFQGIDVSELTLVDVPANQSVDALVSGRVDAVAAWQPYTDEAKEALRGHVVSWSVQEDQPSYTLLMSRAEWTTENAEVISRFLKALVQAEDYVASSPEAARSFLQEKWNYDVEYVAGIWPEHSFSVLLDQALIVALEDQARWIMGHNLAGQQEMPNFLSYIYAAGLEAVKPEGVSLIR